MPSLKLTLQLAAVSCAAVVASASAASAVHPRTSGLGPESALPTHAQAQVARKRLGVRGSTSALTHDPLVESHRERELEASLRQLAQAMGGELGMSASAAQSSDASTFRADLSGEKKDKQVPMQLQDPEKLFGKLFEELTPRCKDRYHKMIHDEDEAGMHQVDQVSKGKDLTARCAALEGHLCPTQASMLGKHEDKSAEQNLRVTMSMQGRSCVPSECVASQDLHALSTFFQAQAQQLAGRMGEKVDVNLRVDCTAVGGGLSAHSSATGVAVSAAALVASVVASVK